MSHSGPGHKPMSRDNCHYKKSLTLQYLFCLGHIVVATQKNVFGNLVKAIAKHDSRKFLISAGFPTLPSHKSFHIPLYINVLFEDFIHAFHWFYLACRSSIGLFIVIFSKVKKSVNSQRELQDVSHLVVISF